MKKRDQLALLGSVGLGAGLMYLLDPDGGGRRRALARDKAVHGYKIGSQALRKTSIDVSNRTRGLAAQVNSRFHGEHVDDVVLEERVRSKIGHCVSHPSAIHVEAHDGRIILTGPVLASEVDELLVKLHKVRGVQGLENRLQIHESPENIPALQGEPATNGRFSLRNVKPRLAALSGLGALAGAMGLGLLASSSKRSDLTQPLRDKQRMKGRSLGQLEW
jgi:osmotically-inducible protein OsmY